MVTHGTPLLVLVVVLVLDFVVRQIVPRTKDEDDYENTL